MAVVPVNAFGFSSTFKLRELEPVFAEVAQARVAKDQLVATFGESSWALAYDFGAVVFVGVDAAAQQRIVGNIGKKLVGEKHAPMTEDFFIETEAPTYEVHFDRLKVPKLTLEVADIAALVMAQSVAMDYYQRDVDEIEVVTDRIAEELRERGKLTRSVRSLSQFIGLCIATRNDVISTLALFDKPDSTWENEQLDRLWNGLYRMLELDDRYRTLEAKLRMFQDNLVVLVDLARQRHTLALELTVAVLIAMEMLIMLWQILGAPGEDVIVDVVIVGEPAAGVLDAVPRPLVRDVHVVAGDSGVGAAFERARVHLCALERPPDVVVLLSADGSDDPSELPLLLLPIRAGGADLVMGKKEIGERGWLLDLLGRGLGQRLAALLINLVYRQRYSDLSPFRALRLPAWVALALRERGHGYLVEMQIKAARAGLRVVEVPVHARRGARVRLGARLAALAGTSWRFSWLLLRHATAR